MGKKAHSEPALQEVHEWREKLWKETEGKSPEEQVDYINKKAEKIWAEWGRKKKKVGVGNY